MPVTITAAEAAKVIAPKVGKCAVSDQDDVFEILSFAQDLIWRKGKYRDFYREGVVNTSAGEIVMPNGWGCLLGVNVNSNPTVLRGRAWEWHQNGLGSLTECENCSNGWNSAVIDKGEVAVPRAPICEHLIIRSRGCEDDGAFLQIIGDKCDGEEMYTYQTKASSAIASTPNCPCFDPDAKVGDIGTEVVYGEKLGISEKHYTQSVCRYNHIDGIKKSVTNSPVDVYYWEPFEGGDAELVMTLAPHQTSSTLRRYKLPDTCKDCDCVHVLAKTDNPAPIRHPGQPLVVNDMIALTYFAMAADLDFYKKDAELAEVYLAKGIRALEEDMTEHRGHPVMGIQVIGQEFDMNTSMVDIYG